MRDAFLDLLVGAAFLASLFAGCYGVYWIGEQISTHISLIKLLGTVTAILVSYVIGRKIRSWRT